MMEALMRCTRILPPSLQGLTLPAQRPSAPLPPCHRRFFRASALPERGTRGFSREDDVDNKYAVLRFLDMVKDDKTPVEDLRNEAERYQLEYFQHLKEVDQLYKDNLKRADRIVALVEERAEQKAKLVKSLDATSSLFKELETEKTNNGLRIVVEAGLRRFNDLHLTGQCQSAECQQYMTDMELAKYIKKGSVVNKVQKYHLINQSWSRKMVIKHMAVCPHAALKDKYNDENGNTIVSMDHKDLALELASRSDVVWDNLHAHHHIMGAGLNMTLPYGPDRNKADTLFYYSMFCKLDLDVAIVEETKIPTSYADAFKELAESFK